MTKKKKTQAGGDANGTMNQAAGQGHSAAFASTPEKSPTSIANSPKPSKPKPAEPSTPALIICRNKYVAAHETISFPMCTHQPTFHSR